MSDAIAKSYMRNLIRPHRLALRKRELDRTDILYIEEDLGDRPKEALPSTYLRVMWINQRYMSPGNDFT